MALLYLREVVDPILVGLSSKILYPTCRCIHLLQPEIRSFRLRFGSSCCRADISSRRFVRILVPPFPPSSFGDEYHLATVSSCIRQRGPLRWSSRDKLAG